MTTSDLTTVHRSKALAGAAALLLGITGAHRLYLGRPLWWLYPLIALPALGVALRSPEWFKHPGFFIAAVVAVAAMLEAITISLTPDARWDARYNAGSGRRSANGWLPVLIAIAALMLGTVLLMSTLAIALETYFDSLRVEQAR